MFPWMSRRLYCIQIYEYVRCTRYVIGGQSFATLRYTSTTTTKRQLWAASNELRRRIRVVKPAFWPFETVLSYSDQLCDPRRKRTTKMILLLLYLEYTKARLQWLGFPFRQRRCQLLTLTIRLTCALRFCYIWGHWYVVRKHSLLCSCSCSNLTRDRPSPELCTKSSTRSRASWPYSPAPSSSLLAPTYTTRLCNSSRTNIFGCTAGGFCTRCNSGKPYASTSRILFIHVISRTVDMGKCSRPNVLNGTVSHVWFHTMYRSLLPTTWSSRWMRRSWTMVS